MIPLLAAVIITAVFRPRVDLALENLALRQQVAVFKRTKPRPHLHPFDRMFWIALLRVWSRWGDALIIVKPSTVVSWHRKGFRAWWRWKSRPKGRGRPRVDPEVRRLIRKMAMENGWGAPRIHAELMKLGFSISERTVSRYMPKRPADPGAVKRWLVFLHNHRDAIAAMDFFTVPTATFRMLYVFFIVRHGRRQIAHFAVTAHPTADWVRQQLREAFPFDSIVPRHMIFDRDSIFSKAVVATLETIGAKPARTAFRCPWQNPVAERWIGSAGRELLDHVVVFNERQLRNDAGAAGVRAASADSEEGAVER